LGKQKRSPTSLSRARRQRIFNRAILVGTFIVIVVVTGYALSRPQPNTLPAYLNRCIPLKGPYAYNSTFQIFIIVNGANASVPKFIGVSGTCVRPIFTLSGSGTVHISTDQQRTYTLGDFFLVWGNTYGSTWATFNQNQLFQYHAGNGHYITLTVNNTTRTDYENYQLPTDADTTFNPYKIVITYN
jgi:hypothetical protein